MKQVIIVTGASSGMGAEFAKQIAAEQISSEKNISEKKEIWLIARNKDALSKVESEIKEKAIPDSSSEHDKKNIEVKIFPLDISGRNGINNFKQLINKEKESSESEGGFFVSVLVNNAGFGTYGTFANTDIARELDMIDLNCTTLTGICGLVLPYLDKGSRIINVASLASFLPLGNFAVYGATKSYVLSFSMALAAELKDKGIKVCALCPGPVSTNFANVASNGARKIVRHGLPPEKVVAHCLKRSRRGAHTAIMTFKWKFKAAASRFVGRYAGARFTYLFCKRPSNLQQK